MAGAAEPAIALEADEGEPVTEPQLQAAFEAYFDSLPLPAAETIRALLARPSVGGLNADFSRLTWCLASAGMSWLQLLAFLAKGAWAPAGEQPPDQEVMGVLEDAALQLLARPEFTRVNAKGIRDFERSPLKDVFPGLADCTALHLAAFRGRTRLCLAIAQHPEFVEGNATWSGFPSARFHDIAPVDLPAGDTAAHLARRCRHFELSEKLQAVITYGQTALNPRILQVEKTRAEPGFWLLRCRTLSGGEVAQLSWPDDAAPTDLPQGIIAAFRETGSQALEEPLAVWNLRLVGIDDLLGKSASVEEDLT